MIGGIFLDSMESMEEMKVVKIAGDMYRAGVGCLKSLFWKKVVYKYCWVKMD